MTGHSPAIAVEPPIRLPADALEGDDVRQLLAVVTALSSARDLEAVTAVVRRAARELTAADGVTFVVREGDLVHYADENAIAPLWKGRRFPIGCCISGWSILHRRVAVVEDIYADDRIPHDAYAPTFVRSLAMAPIRAADPLGAIGAYWASRHLATAREVAILEALAAASGIALENAALYRRLDDAARARDDFLAAAAHELRTPLTPLQLKVQHALRLHEPASDGDAAAARRALADADLHVRKLARLIDAMVDVSAVERGELRLSPEPLDAAALARDVVARFERDARRARVTLEVDAPAPVQVRGDRSRLEQVLAELVSNALRFGDSRPVRVSVAADGDRARIDVVDQGIGISAEDQARIFDRFERAVSTRHFGGLGIGLWLAREFVEAHGGRIEVQSRRGEGSRFTVLLPR